GSVGAIPQDVSLGAICCELLLRALSLGLLPHFFCKLRPVPASTEASEWDDDSGDEWDEDFFQRNEEQVSSRGHGGVGKRARVRMSGRANERVREYAARALRMYTAWRLPSQVARLWGRGGLLRILEWWLQRLYAFLMVPKVKFCLHTIALVFYICLVTSFLCGPFVHGWPWMWQQGHPPASLTAPGTPLSRTSHIPHSSNSLNSADYLTRAGALWLEVMVWLMTIAQACPTKSSVVGEMEQLALRGWKEYWSDGWNKFDVLSLSCMLAAFAIRMALLLDGGYPAHSLGLGADATDTLNSYFQNLSVLAVTSLILRSLEALSYNKDIGELYTIFLSMLSESAAVYIILTCYAVAFGVAFTALLPQSVTRAEVFERPFFATFWALLGDFNLVHAARSEVRPLSALSHVSEDSDGNRPLSVSPYPSPFLPDALPPRAPLRHLPGGQVGFRPKHAQAKAKGGATRSAPASPGELRQRLEALRPLHAVREAMRVDAARSSHPPSRQRPAVSTQPAAPPACCSTSIRYPRLLSNGVVPSHRQPPQMAPSRLTRRERAEGDALAPAPAVSWADAADGGSIVRPSRSASGKEGG
ncbi:MAG: hypothetical protein SGPRY_001372, partial [Prymnesium sp.]